MSSRIRVIVQARTTSSRLPGKSLLPVGGAALAILVLARAALPGQHGFDVALATSGDPTDDTLACLASEAGYPVVRGPLDDVLARFVLGAADLAPHDIVVRLTADNPVPDGQLVRALVTAMTEAGSGYAYIDQKRVPYGLSAEAFTVSALRDADAGATDAADREHVTPWIRRRLPATAFVPQLPAGVPAHMRCTVDTLDDFVRVAALFAASPDPVRAPWQELLVALARTVHDKPPQVPVRDVLGFRQSALVLGTAQLGMAYGIANGTGVPADDEVERILHTAARRGVTHLDTARAYGHSERRIGRSQAMPRGSQSPRLQIVTKVLPLADEDTAAGPRTVARAVEASVERSLAELGGRSHRLAAVLLHRGADAHAAGGAAWRRLRDYRAKGVTDRIGVSVQSPAELLTALDLEELGYVQLPFNVLDRRWLDPAVTSALAARSEVVVTARSVFLQGLLVAGDQVRWPAAVDAASPVRAIDRAVTELGRAGRADLCVAYALSWPWVTSVVIGADTAAQVRHNAELVSAPPLTAAERELVLERVPPGPEHLVDPSRWSTGSAG